MYDLIGFVKGCLVRKYDPLHGAVATDNNSAAVQIPEIPKNNTDGELLLFSKHSFLVMCLISSSAFLFILFFFIIC